MTSSDDHELDLGTARAILGLGRALNRGEAHAELLCSALAALDALAPQAVVRGDAQMRRLLGSWRYEATGSPLQQHVLDRERDRKDLAAIDGLELLLLSHPDGFLREAALRKLDCGLPNPYVVAIVAMRLNDWVVHVRRAAAECAMRTYPKTAGEILGRAALYLIDSTRSWRRWTSEGAALDAALSAADAPAQVVERFRVETTGPLGRTLRSALRNDAFDRWLPDLASGARTPSVRSTALRVLIDGRATWFERYERAWIDKTAGLTRKAPVMGSRPLRDPPPRAAMIALGGRDRSAAVRKVAAEALATHWAEFDDLDGLLAPFLGDKSRAVRERAEFVVRRREGRLPSFMRDSGQRAS